jgi:ATP adenylyltransferase
MTYIARDQDEAAGPESRDPPPCIFCSKPNETRDQENMLIYRGKTAFVLMNLYPYNNGHLMVAPYQHTSKLASLSNECTAEIMRLVQGCEAALFAAYSPQGYNIGMNVGHVAGAGIADHLHMHVVPRWSGDTNFMPVIADTKVLPDSLSGSYDKILLAWHNTFSD